GFGKLCLHAYQLCQTEIKNLQGIVAAENQVARLQIAMNNAYAVRRLQPLRQLNAKIHDIFLWQRAGATQLRIQRLAGNVLRDQEINFAFLAKLKRHGDIGMTELGERQSLFMEAAAR